MARHYLDAYPVDGGKIEIPAPAIDMTSAAVRSGSSGTFLSGGAYVRKSLYGARTINASWNDLNTADSNRLRQLEEAGPFHWDNPIAHQNVALPWLANQGNVTGAYNALGTVSNYFIKHPNIAAASATNIPGTFEGYPRTAGGETPVALYVLEGSPEIEVMQFIIPEGHDCFAWAIGTSTGPTIRVSGSTIVMHNPSGGTELPPTASLVGGTGLSRVTLTGSGTINLAGIQIRIVPKWKPVGVLNYSPGLGVSSLEFVEEGLQVVHHSAALDLQTATATWLETGWWK